MTRTLEVSPGALGLLLGAAAVGGLIGAVIAGRVSRRIGIGPAFVFGCVLFTVPLVLVPLADGPHTASCWRCCSPPSSSPGSA